MPKIEDLDAFYRSLGERIKEARTAAKIKQEDLAKILGLKRTSVVNIEKGRQRAPLHTLLELAFFLNVELDSLIPQIKMGLQKDIEKKITKNISALKKYSNDNSVIAESEKKVRQFIKLSLAK